ncbi:MAG TPA: hypothetical protein VFD97_01830 [Acidimicrobiia bacterium]|nr:hypothetical protein [Acidimicrobiia bacterium]
MPERPVIVHVQESLEDGDARVTVTLSWEEEEFSGQAIGETDASARPRLVGEATLRAIEQVAHDAISLDLSAVATQELGDVRIALAQVDISNFGERFVGSALIREDDPSLATVRAVLDALNRRISLLDA